MLLSLCFFGAGLLILEVDLLAFLVYATYSSVFIALAILSLHFNLTWGGAVSTAGQQISAQKQRFGVLGGVIILGWGFF